jgi:hypothetical protein
VGQAPVDAVIERRGRSIKISPDQGAPYAAIADVLSGDYAAYLSTRVAICALRRASAICYAEFCSNEGCGIRPRGSRCAARRRPALCCDVPRVLQHFRLACDIPAG